jgi:hypothetical protein
MIAAFDRTPGILLRLAAPGRLIEGVYVGLHCRYLPRFHYGLAGSLARGWASGLRMLRVCAERKEKTMSLFELWLLLAELLTSEDEESEVFVGPVASPNG